MPASVLVALGSNLGNRELFLRRALFHLHRTISIVRVSGMYVTDPVGTPPGSPWFLNMVVAGHTGHQPEEMLALLLEIEARLGRTRGVRNAPRTVDLDLIFHSANLRSGEALTLPHPRYRSREFVMKPLRELELPWRDPATGEGLA
ncbi:MAG TPA: 2-amino-4-hydroxy-6-hydroxymethyldihydropteridine diphosphokinase [Thermoanaerobaculia bacterium]|nr:2-amino-4-hydroxy-6-hydroxymethyldihydropteridine diphosphokinase [Thermoanaerobaculia bacterium]